MNSFSSHVPPGFRFHPTDEELVDYYLRKKIASKRIDFDVIKDVNLYIIEPWDLQELCGMGTEEQNEWYFFSHKDKKYPTGTRTNRATKAGFWKATGRDKAIYSKRNLVGMRKTLVFYKGRAPNGLKSDWIMHEYRLETNENATPQEEGWVVCRVFKKKLAAVRKMGEFESPSNWSYDDRLCFLETSPRLIIPYTVPTYPNVPCKQEFEFPTVQYNHLINSQNPYFYHLPQLESPQNNNINNNNVNGSIMQDQAHILMQQNVDPVFESEQQVTDWRILDKFVASQLSNEESEAGNSTRTPEMMDQQEYVASMSTSSGCDNNFDPWK